MNKIKQDEFRSKLMEYFSVIWGENDHIDIKQVKKLNKFLEDKLQKYSVQYEIYTLPITNDETGKSETYWLLRKGTKDIEL